MKYYKVLFVILLVACLVQAYEWKPIVPAARNFARMVVDSVNQRVILFGGASHGFDNRWHNDIWEMPLGDSACFYWLPIKPTGILPTARGGMLFVYVPTQQKTYAICGDTGIQCSGLTNEVWALNLTVGSESWEKLYPTGTPPSGRRQIEGIYCPGRNSIILFGGESDNYVYYDDVWELKLNNLTWQQIIVTGNRPTSRAAYALIFDKTSNSMIMFGGAAASAGWYNEVWALSLTSGNEHWTRFYPSGSLPEPRSSFAFGHDIKSNKLYIGGGWNYDLGILFNDVYILDIPSLIWSKPTTTGEGPFERRNQCGTYDYFNDNFIVFGGDMGAGSGCYFGDCYILDIANSTQSNTEWEPKAVMNVAPTIFVNSSPDLIRIRYILPVATKITVDIIDINGRVINTLFSGKTDLSTGLISWNKKDIQNRDVSTGTYFCRLETEDMSIAKKFVIIK
jgi:hypothetical protein